MGHFGAFDQHTSQGRDLLEYFSGGFKNSTAITI